MKDMTRDEDRLFKMIRDDVTNLHVIWKMYKQLYSSGAERIELLNKSGSLFFFEVQRFFLDTIILFLCRLLDSSNSFGKDNLSLERLVESLADPKHLSLKSNLKDILNDIRKNGKAFSMIRHKRIAHNDFLTKTASSKGEKILPGIQYEMIEHTLESIRDMLDKYDLTLYDCTTGYEDTILPFGTDGERLIECLQLAHS